jgi:hypothetical protein
MNCSSCQSPIIGDSKFCPNCGTPTSLVSKACHFCGVKNEFGATFCVDCGKPQKSDLMSSSEAATPSLSSATNNEFLYLLSDEKLLSVTSSKKQIPYGSLGVTLADGVVVDITKQNISSNVTSNAISEFLTKLMDFGKTLIGQKKQNIKTYVLMNLSQLPIVSYSHPVPIPGTMNGVLRFDFWVGGDSQSDTNKIRENIGLFFQRYVGDKDHLTLNDFKNIAIANIPNLLGDGLNLHFNDPVTLRIELDQFTNKLFLATGISSTCNYLKGRESKRKQIDVSKISNEIICPSCGVSYVSPVKFCENDGYSFPPSSWVESSRYLLDSKGEQITLRLSIVEDVTDEYANHAITDEDVIRSVIDLYGPHLRNRDLSSLIDVSLLKNISRELSTIILSEFKGHFTEINVIDIRTSQEDWFFQTDALIREELRKIESDKQALQVDGAQIDLEEASFAITMRRLLQGNSEELQKRRIKFEAKQKLEEVELAEHELNTRIELRKENIKDQAEKERIQRDKERIIHERDAQRELLKGERADEFSQVDHEMSLEKTVLKHDLEINEITGEAQSRAKRRDITDDSFATEEALRLETKKKEEALRVAVKEKEEALRVAVKEKEQLGHIDEDLKDRENQRQIDKMAKMAELEANMARQDYDFELQKAQSMKGMSAQEILAMQAAQLANKGGSESVADIVKVIAQSQADASGAAIKDQLYKEMLNIQKEASQQAIDAHKHSVDAILTTNDNILKVSAAAVSQSTKGFEKAADIAQKTNEKSMESMSKVATATAGRKDNKVDDKKSDDDKTNDMVFCKDLSCNESFSTSSIPKFGGKCGHPQFFKCINDDCSVILKGRVSICSDCGTDQNI